MLSLKELSERTGKSIPWLRKCRELRIIDKLDIVYPEKLMDDFQVIEVRLIEKLQEQGWLLESIKNLFSEKLFDLIGQEITRGNITLGEHTTITDPIEMLDCEAGTEACFAADRGYEREFGKEEPHLYLWLELSEDLKSDPDFKRYLYWRSMRYFDRKAASSQINLTDILYELHKRKAEKRITEEEASKVTELLQELHNNAKTSAKLMSNKLETIIQN